MKRKEWTSIVLVWLFWLIWAVTFGCKIANTAKLSPMPPQLPKPQVRALTTRVRPPAPPFPASTNLYLIWTYPEATTNVIASWTLPNGSQLIQYQIDYASNCLFTIHRTNRPVAPSLYWHTDVVLTNPITFWRSNLFFNTNSWTWQTNRWAESNVYVFEITNGVAEPMGFVWVSVSNTASHLSSR